MGKSCCLLKKPNGFLYGLMAAIMMLVALPVKAASVSFFLDQSNKLPDGVPYLSVTLTENGTGGVDFLVQTLNPLNDAAGRHFGIQKFGFSFDDGSWGEVSGVPDYWRIRENRRMDGFGKFDIRLEGRKKARTDSLSFTVGGVDLGDFDSLFAAHVAGFEWCEIEVRRWCGAKDCLGSAYFAGSMDMPVSEVPVPAAAWLFGSGFLGLLGVARHRRVRNSAVN